MPGPTTPTGMRPPDPVIQARYKVEFPKLSGVFTKVSVTSASVAAVPYQFTGPDGQPTSSFQPGLRTLPTISLERGMTNDLSAWNWHQEVLQGKMASARVNGTISILDNEGKPAASFNIMGAWPTKVDMPALMATGGSVGVEVIGLVCEGFERAS
jgi:phage tail-like protein